MRVFIQANGVVVVALDQPIRSQRLHRPRHAFGGLRAVVDEIAEAQNLVNVRFGGQHCLQCGPVAVNVRYEQDFHDSLPCHISLPGRSHQHEAISSESVRRRQIPLPSVN